MLVRHVLACGSMLSTAHEGCRPHRQSTVSRHPRPGASTTPPQAGPDPTENVGTAHVALPRGPGSPRGPDLNGRFRRNGVLTSLDDPGRRENGGREPATGRTFTGDCS